jgi:tyrosine-protein kinase Etk/Wzc
MTEKDMFQLGESEELDLKSILFKYLRYWYWFIIAILLCLGLAFLYLTYATPQYHIESTLLIKDEKKGPGLSGGDAFGGLDIFGSSKNVDNEIEVLRSKSLMQRVLNELNLETSYFEKGILRNSEIYGDDLPVNVKVKELTLTAFKKGVSIQINIKDHQNFELIEDMEELSGQSSHKFGQEIQRPYGTFTVLANPQSQLFEQGNITIAKFHDIRKLADYYCKKLISVESINKNASVLRISMISPIQEKGKNVVNKLIEVYEKEAIEDKNLMASNTVKFIDERLSYLTLELSEVEKDVEEYKKQNELTGGSSETTLFLEQASENNKKLADFEIRIDVLRSIERYLKNQGNQFELVPNTLNIEEPTLIALVSKFNELQLERKRMMRTTQPNNPLVLNISEQLEHLRANILESLQNIRNGLIITRNNLQATATKFKSRIQQVPSIERELREISRQQGIKQELYLYLLQKREESALTLAATVSTNSRVIDPAMAEDEPIKPIKLLVLVIALVFGICLPVAIIWIKEVLNDKVQEIKDVEQATKTPILGEIYQNSSPEILVATEMNKTPIAELFRLIRTNLQFATIGKENKVIMLTSSMSGDGKTFISINLAATLALTGRKVVIVGFDLRKPRLMQDLGLALGNGVSNYLISENLSVDEIIVPSKVSPNLQVIGSGPIPPNPGELMLSSRIGNLIEELKERFDYIVIDSSPVGQISDSYTLAPYIDSTIYVIRYKYTFKQQLEIIDDIYQNKKLNHPMIVLNGKDENSYGGYGYGYGYEEKQKKSGYKKLREKVGV